MGLGSRAVCRAALTAALFWPEPASAGAWQRDAFSRLDIQTVEAYRSASDTARFAQLTIRNYLELGLPGAFSLGGQIAHVEQESVYDGGATTASGVAEAELSGFYHWDREGPLVGAVKLRGRFATAKFAGPQRVMGQDAAIGFGSLHGYSSGPFFAELDAGYLRSLGKDADQIVLDTTLGAKRGRSMLLLRSFHTESVLPKSEDGLDFDRHQISLSGVLPIRRTMHLEFGARADIEARGFAEGEAVFLSFWWSL